MAAPNGKFRERIRTMPAQTSDADRADAIDEALYDAACDGDGRPRPDALAHHLAKHGLVIVDAASHDHMRTALQLIGSCDLDHLIVTVARNALAKAS